MKPEFKDKPPKKPPRFKPEHDVNFSRIDMKVFVNVDHVLMIDAFAWHFKYYANIKGMWYQKENGEMHDAWKHDIRYDKTLYHDNGKQCWFLEYSAYEFLCNHYELDPVEPPWTERNAKLSGV